MTILAKMHDKMAAQAPRYGGPHSVDRSSPAPAPTPAPRPTSAARPVPANLFEDATPAEVQPALTVQSNGLTLPEVFKMFAAAQDVPGRVVTVYWSVGGESRWKLSVNFNHQANLAHWLLEISDGRTTYVAMDSKSRDLTEIYRTVLDNKQIA